jgi:hypothetical protein
MRIKMNKNKWFFFVPFLFALVVSCQTESEVVCEEHEKTSCGEDVTKTNIRLKNVSNYDFCNVVIGASEMVNFGIVKSGQSTCYVSFDEAYRYSYVQLFIDGKEFKIQPVDFVGEEALGEGYFTYSIGVEDRDERTLSQTTTED